MNEKFKQEVAHFYKKVANQPTVLWIFNKIKLFKEKEELKNVKLHFE